MNAALDGSERAALTDQERDALDAGPRLWPDDAQPEQTPVVVSEQLHEAGWRAHRDIAAVERIRDDRCTVANTLFARHLLVESDGSDFGRQKVDRGLCFANESRW